MSRIELIDAFLDGRIGRREFIQGLVGSGIALGAAAAHAAALKPAVAQKTGDFYGDFYNPGDRARAQALCIQNANEVFRAQIQECRVNFTGRRRAECIRTFRERRQAAVRACRTA